MKKTFLIPYNTTMSNRFKDFTKAIPIIAITYLLVFWCITQLLNIKTDDYNLVPVYNYETMQMETPDIDLQSLSYEEIQDMLSKGTLKKTVIRHVPGWVYVLLISLPTALIFLLFFRLDEDYPCISSLFYRRYKYLRTQKVFCFQSPHYNKEEHKQI